MQKPQTVSVPDFTSGDFDLSTPRPIMGSDIETWVVDEQRGWQILARFDFDESAPRITHLRIHSANGELSAEVPPGGIMTDTLRRLSFHRLFALLNNDDGSGSRFTLSVQGLDPDRNFANLRRPGRRGRADLPYAVWADRYVRMAATSRSPYPVLAAEYPENDERRIRDFIQTARRRGLIEGMSQGRAGGRLTPKAKDLLARTREESK